MNRDILQGKWKEIMGDVKSWWGKLTDDDIKQIEGSKDKLIGILQKRYGYSKEQAMAEIDRRIAEHEARPVGTR